MQKLRTCAALGRVVLGVTLIAGSILMTPIAMADGAPVCLLPERLDPIFADSLELIDQAPFPALDEPGPYTVLTQPGQTQRIGRDIPWVAAVPERAVSPPLLLFAPAFQVSTAAYRDWTEHLASWGILAVSAQPAGGLANLSHLAKALDLSAVLDDLLVPGLFPLSPDPDRIVLSGHSLGGKLAVMVANQDARVDALFLLDPVNSAGQQGYSQDFPDVVPDAVQRLAIPLAFIGELLDATSVQPLPACAPLSQNYQTFFEAAASSPSAYEWTLDGASHTDFVTNPDTCGTFCIFCSVGTLDKAVTHAFMRAAGVAFIRAHFDGDTEACTWLTGRRVPAAASIRQSP